MIIPTTLSIAGSDCSGGAGIQADLKTFMAHQVYGMSVITAITAQNTMGVTNIMDCHLDVISDQLDAVFTDIFPHSVKIGMVSISDTIGLIADKLQQYQAQNIVLDPVMISTSGHHLLDEDAVHTLITKLLPLATIITPNIPEAEVLCDFKIKTEEDILAACKKISTLTPAYILIKGGHLETHCNDYLYKDEKLTVLEAQKLDTDNTHGTGCTLSSAIASNLARGYDIDRSVSLAKDYVFGALDAGMNLGHGNGPINHFFNLERTDDDAAAL